MFIASLLAVVISQTAVPPPSAEPDAFPSLQDPQSNDIRLATRFISEHLISLEFSPMTGMSFRQQDRVYKLGESLADAMKLVPEAAALAVRADDEFRFYRVTSIVALSLAGVGLGLTLAGALIATSSLALPLMFAGLACALVGLVASLIGLPASISYQDHLMQAVNTYNQAIVNRIQNAPPAAPVAPAMVPGARRETSGALLELAQF